MVVCCIVVETAFTTVEKVFSPSLYSTSKEPGVPTDVHVSVASVAVTVVEAKVVGAGQLTKVVKVFSVISLTSLLPQRDHICTV